MYKVLDIPAMMKEHQGIRTRKHPLSGYNSTLLVRPGTPLGLIPPGSQIKYVYGSWEIHMPLKNKKIVKSLAKELNAIAFII